MRAERSRKDVNEIREADAGSIRDNNEEDFYNEDRRSSLGGAAEASLAFANRKRHVVAHLSYPPVAFRPYVVGGGLNYLIN